VLQAVSVSSPLLLVLLTLTVPIRGRVIHLLVRAMEVCAVLCLQLLPVDLVILALVVTAIVWAKTCASVSHVIMVTHVSKVPATLQMVAALTTRLLARVLVVFAVTALVWLAAALVRVVFALTECVMDSLLMPSPLLALTVLHGMQPTMSRGILILILQTVSGASLMVMLSL